MTAVQRNAIATPATGLLVFDTDSLSLFMYTGSWKKVAALSALSQLIRGTTNGDVLKWNGTEWVVTPLTSLFQFFYRDKDGDGFGDKFFPVYSPTAPEGFVANNSDCNDDDATITPNITWYRDVDGDGHGTTGITQQACAQPAGYAATSDDCNDNDPLIHPEAGDPCDGIDNNCDGTADNDAIIIGFGDSDNDGYGDESKYTEFDGTCTLPPGFVEIPGDCNDDNAAIFPGAIEVCNGLDDNCDGVIDEGCNTFYRDADGDGYGNPADVASGSTPPSGYVSSSGDCNDANPAINPGAAEICNGVDDNCDAITDINAVDRTTFFRDQDGDGYGTPVSPIQACTAPAGYVTNSIDCNDNASNVRPGLTEVCDGLDNDCDGTIDEGVKLTFYQDQDGDGYGNISVTTQACTAPSGYVTNNQDCNDANAGINPGVTTDVAGDLIDSNCDGIDGNESQAIFVAVTGINSNPGTKAAPVRTITEGILKAQAGAKTQVYIGNGTYAETVTLVNGISLYGSYLPASGWSRSATANTQITGSSSAGVVMGIEGNNITSTTAIDRVMVVTPNATQPGSSNYGIYCNSCAGVRLSNSTIIAGSGSPGVAGTNGTAGASGSNGLPGGSGSCDGDVLVQGGAGGNSPCGRTGGAGGAGGRTINNGVSGQTGVGGTSGGIGGVDGDPGGDGQPGGNGAAGSIGTNGTGGSGGSISGGFWSGTFGANGTAGSNGNGGGGGGGGGGQNGTFVDDGTGNGGGGGGAGGCGGGLGTGGTAGGGSFGLFVISSNGFTITNNTIQSSNGGAGGAGGTGGNGGTGGTGGAGGTACSFEVGTGGNGGSGGIGGRGGHGGGGAGGPSFAIYRNSTTLSTTGNTLSNGAGGNGGTSSGTSGSTGASGTIF